MGAITPLAYRSKADLVMDHLREEIQRGHYRPGDRLVLDAIASSLNVSKIPVREAITRLTGEGLLELQPHVGPIVPLFTGADVLETAILRVAVEAAALQIAIPLHDEVSLIAAEGIFDAMRAGSESFPELNVKFHTALIAPIPFRFIHQNVESLLRRAQRYAPSYRVPGYRAEAQNEHLALMEGARACDVPLVLRLNEAHIFSAARQLAKRLDESKVERVDK